MEKVKLLFGADVVPTTEISEKYFIDGDIKTLFGEIPSIIKNYDRLLVNLECALTDSEKGIEKCGPNIKADKRCADTLKKLGVTDIMLANNHVYDFGRKGFKDTLEQLDRVKIPYTGVGENNEDCRKIHYFVEKGKRVAIVNVCEHEYSYALEDREGTNAYDPYLTMQDIRLAKKNADFVIAIYHGGKEHCHYPSPRLRNLCREMVLNGACVVLTQHSHCIGCYEEYEGGHIVYGTGNFHFAWPNKTDLWNTSLLVGVELGDSVDINFYPLRTVGATVDIATGDKAKEILDGFYARNEELKNGAWKKGWREFCLSMKEMYDWALREVCLEEEPNEYKNEVFAHFLDCEAHTDVWRELHPTKNATNEKGEN